MLLRSSARVAQVRYDLISTHNTQQLTFPCFSRNLKKAEGKIHEEDQTDGDELLAIQHLCLTDEQSPSIQEAGHNESSEMGSQSDSDFRARSAMIDAQL